MNYEQGKGVEYKINAWKSEHLRQRTMNTN
jgi:hypothetical protein